MMYFVMTLLIVVLIILIIFALFLFHCVKKYKNDSDRLEKLSNKHLSLFQLMNEWVNVKIEGTNLEKYFIDKRLYTVAIYGFNSVGRTLYNELNNSNVCVLYAIDQQRDKIIAPNVDVYLPSEDLPEVDVVVVTSITFFEEIESYLAKKMKCPIISLEEVVFDV